MPVLFDGPDACTVDVPHGTYTVARDGFANTWVYRVEDDTGYVELHTTRAGEATHFLSSGSRPGRARLELLDVALLGALAFRDRRRDGARVAS